MTAKKKDTAKKAEATGAYIANAGVVIQQPITETLEKNYMPYAMSVIISRAIPEIDGFKPSHRKLLYTMYKMGLLTGAKTKSANIVGTTMKLNPHGDASIYETMVRLTKGNQSLLHPYVDSKGNFGKAYSRDMAYAASRYTEAKLDTISSELFKDIDKDTIDFVDNYDNTLKEPSLFPVTFPTILVNANTGIAVGMASSICPFNLEEVCETTIQLLKNPNHNIMTTLKAPDFPCGGYIMYDADTMTKIYKTGRGSFKVRARYTYDKHNNCIEVTEIPPTTTVEAIMDKIIDMVKLNKLREISDLRDETDLNGLKITIDLKRGQDPDKVMRKLFKSTPLEDSFSCNFNVLIGNMPRVMGVSELLNEWIAFRKECVKRRVFFELNKKKDKLHLLEGLSKILLDIDKAVAIVRETEQESEVVPNLMIGFGIDQIQADYVAEIKLRHLNREYILKRTEEIDSLRKDIIEMEAILESETKIKNIIIAELRDVIKKYSQPRKAMLLYSDDIEDEEEEEVAEDYPVNHFFSKEGYYKKITPQSLRMSGAHKLKDGDEIIQHIEGNNTDNLLFFTNNWNVYKKDAYEFADTKTSVLGEFIPVELGMEQEELPLYMAVVKEYKGFMLFCFENGKVAKIDMASYETKTKRKRLLKAYSDKAPIVGMFYVEEDEDIALTSSSGRVLVFNSALLDAKTTKDSQGVMVMNQNKGATVVSVALISDANLITPDKFRSASIPSKGKIATSEDTGEQLKID